MPYINTHTYKKTGAIFRKRTRSWAHKRGANLNFDEGYYPEKWILPGFYRATGLNDKIKGKSLSPDKPLEPVAMFAPQHGQTSRLIHITNPQSYIYQAQVLMSIQSELITLLASPLNAVTSYSLDSLFENIVTDRSSRAADAWSAFSQSDYLATSLGFQTVIKIDIKNFYPSIYSHALSWALHGKIHARDNRFDKLLSGNRLDASMRKAFDGKTNGLAIGPITSDIMAEIILCAVDQSFSRAARSRKLQFEAARYKDDYRIFCNSGEDAENLLRLMSSALSEYDLGVNPDKTRILNWPIEELAIDWRLGIPASLDFPDKEAGKYPVPFQIIKDTIRQVSFLERDAGFKGSPRLDLLMEAFISIDPSSWSDDEKTFVLNAARHFASLWPKSFPKYVTLIMLYTRYFRNEKSLTKVLILSLWENAITTSNTYQLIWLVGLIKLYDEKLLTQFRSSVLQMRHPLLNLIFYASTGNVRGIRRLKSAHDNFFGWASREGIELYDDQYFNNVTLQSIAKEITHFPYSGL